jgi:hypothetical protein
MNTNPVLRGGAGHLSIYLNDHLSGAVAGVELARRAARYNRGNALGDALAKLATELEDDRHSLERIMVRLGVRRDPAKLAVGWTAEKFGRLKLNGSVLSYSPLSRLEELELLLLGVEGKLLLWEALRRGELGNVDVTELINRARSQRRRLKHHRLQALDVMLLDRTRRLAAASSKPWLGSTTQPLRRASDALTWKPLGPSPP